MKLQASKAHIWSRCAGSTKMPRAAQLDNDARTDGIERHERMEKALMGSPVDESGEFDELIGKIRELYPGGKGVTHVELELPRTFSEGYDKADVIVDDKRVVTIIDSKFGFVEVPAENNRQLLSYMIGYHTRIGKVTRDYRLMIYQPTPNGYPTFKEWYISADDFADWLREIALASQAAQDLENLTQVTGDHCTYCPSKLFCGSYLSKARGVQEVENANPTPGSTYDLDLAGIAAGYEELSQKVKLLKQLEKAYEEQLVLALRAGKDAGDWSLARTKGKRFWKADVEQLKTFQQFSGVKLLEEKPVSITEARKNKEFKEQIESFMEVSSGSEKLVKIDKTQQAKEVFK